MSGPRRCAIAPGLLTALLVVVCTGTGAAEKTPGIPSSPRCVAVQALGP